MTSEMPTDNRLEFPQRVVSGRIIGVLPDVPADDLVAPLEVMVQERIRAFSLPVSDAERRRRVVEVFGHRACFGVHGVVRVEDVAQLVEQKVAFVLATGADDAVVGALRAAGIPCAVDALTPTEVRAVWDRGVDAVQVAPADMGPAAYGVTLAELAPGARMIPRGGIGSYSLRRWLEAGAVAVCVDEVLVGDAAEGGAMPALRERCRSVRAVVDDVDA